MTADQRRARLLDLAEAAFEDPAQRGLVDVLCREIAAVHGGQRPAPHGVDVGDRVGRRDLAVEERVVHDRRDVIDRLDQRQIVGETVHSGVVAGLEADEQVGVGLGRAGEFADDFAQVHRTELRRSTAGTGVAR